MDHVTASRLPSITLVSTYPPTRCGLATYSASLIRGLTRLRGGTDGLSVARVLRGGDHFASDRFVSVAFGPSSPAAVGAAARQISGCDVALVQHEFGIYGPDDGASIVDLVLGISAPVVTTFHAVREVPSARRRQIVRDVAAASTSVIVTIPAAIERLVEVYGVARERIVQIPHGAGLASAASLRPSTRDRPLLLTWGLLSPHKGLEHVIQALPELRDLEPRPLYWIQGMTHPAVYDREGERYRIELEKLARRLGVEDMVHLDNRYLDDSELAELVGSASVVVLPYERFDQVSSGVLSEAVAMGKPIVATPFAHAQELKGEHKGLILVQASDPGQLAKALHSALTDPEHAIAAADRSRAAPDWDRVAAAYSEAAIRAVHGRSDPSPNPGHASPVSPPIGESAASSS